MGLECPMCGLTEEYIIDDSVTPGKKWCKGCKAKFMPTGSMYKHSDSFTDDAKFQKGGKKNDSEATLHRG